MGYYLEIVAQIGLIAILALALNVICGMTGLLHLGQAGFYAVGAYAAGLMALHCWIPALGPANFLVSATCGVVAASIFAVIIGIPCLRLRGDYLAIATLGFGEVIRLCLETMEITGGATGMRIPREAKFVSWWMIWIFVVITWVLLMNLKRSAIGRAMMAIREDEIAARAMGVHVPYYKTLSFILCAAFAGLAGALFVHKVGYIAPKKFSLFLSIDALLIIVLGGMGSFTGSLLAAIVLVSMREVLGMVPYVGDHRELFYAIILILLVRFFPNGILGLRECPGWLTYLWRRKKEPGEAANG